LPPSIPSGFRNSGLEEGGIYARAKELAALPRSSARKGKEPPISLRPQRAAAAPRRARSFLAASGVRHPPPRRPTPAAAACPDEAAGGGGGRCRGRRGGGAPRARGGRGGVGSVAAGGAGAAARGAAQGGRPGGAEAAGLGAAPELQEGAARGRRRCGGLPRRGLRQPVHGRVGELPPGFSSLLSGGGFDSVGVESVVCG